MSEINNVSPAAEPRVSDLVLQLLAKSIADAKRGSTSAVVVIAVNPDGLARANFAGEADLMPSINMGLDLFKLQLLHNALGQPGAVQLNSGILKPGH